MSSFSSFLWKSHLHRTLQSEGLDSQCTPARILHPRPAAAGGPVGRSRPEPWGAAAPGAAGRGPPPRRGSRRAPRRAPTASAQRGPPCPPSMRKAQRRPGPTATTSRRLADRKISRTRISPHKNDPHCKGDPCVAQWTCALAPRYALKVTFTKPLQNTPIASRLLVSLKMFENEQQKRKRWS